VRQTGHSVQSPYTHAHPCIAGLGGAQWTHDSTYQVPDRAWLKVERWGWEKGTEDGRRSIQEVGKERKIGQREQASETNVEGGR